MQQRQQSRMEWIVRNQAFSGAARSQLPQQGLVWAFFRYRGIVASDSRCHLEVLSGRAEGFSCRHVLSRSDEMEGEEGLVQILLAASWLVVRTASPPIFPGSTPTNLVIQQAWHGGNELRNDGKRGHL